MGAIIDEMAQEMAGMERIELPLTEPESAVLPLDDIPMNHGALVARLHSTQGLKAMQV